MINWHGVKGKKDPQLSAARRNKNCTQQNSNKGPIRNTLQYLISILVVLF